LSPRAFGLLRFIAGVVVKLVTTLFTVSIVIFLLISTPGNTARDVLGEYATQQDLNRFDLQFGLNRSIVDRYLSWINGIFHGNLGKSFSTQGSVWSTISPALEKTVIEVVFAWLIIVIVAVPIGLFAGVRLRGRKDVALSFVTVALAAIPEFMIALVLVVVVGVKLGWLPLDSTALDSGGVFSAPKAYVLPAITIALGVIPYTLRLTRANARDVSSEPYVRAAALRGIGEPALSGRYVLPNAAPPVVSALGLQLAGLVGGVFVAENVFAFPGIGQQIVQSAGQRDAPVVLAIALIIGAFFVVVNVAADVVVRLITPKLRDVSL
jgi:peptide/nickel transport system permease protein